MWVQRPPQVSPYLREKTRKTNDVEQEGEAEDASLSSPRSFDSFLTLERRESVANDGVLLHGSTLYQLASQSNFNPHTENKEPARRYYRKLHEKSMALVIAGVDAHHFDV